MSYYTGVVTGRQLDFEKAIYNIENGLSTEWEDISRPTDLIDNCGTRTESATDQLDVTSIVQLKLVNTFGVQYSDYFYTAFVFHTKN